MIPKPCQWTIINEPKCELKPHIVVQTCRKLPDIINGSWKCSSELIHDNESCYSICHNGFKLEDTNVKRSRYDCDCSGKLSYMI